VFYSYIPHDCGIFYEKSIQKLAIISQISKILCDLADYDVFSSQIQKKDGQIYYGMGLPDVQLFDVWGA